MSKSRNTSKLFLQQTNKFGKKKNCLLWLIWQTYSLLIMKSLKYLWGFEGHSPPLPPNFGNLGLKWCTLCNFQIYSSKKKLYRKLCSLILCWNVRFHWYMGALVSEIVHKQLFTPIDISESTAQQKRNLQKRGRLLNSYLFLFYTVLVYLLIKSPDQSNYLVNTFKVPEYLIPRWKQCLKYLHTVSAISVTAHSFHSIPVTCALKLQKMSLHGWSFFTSSV